MDSITREQLYDFIRVYTSRRVISKVLMDNFIIIPKEGNKI